MSEQGLRFRLVGELGRVKTGQGQYGAWGVATVWFERSYKGQTKRGMATVFASDEIADRLETLGEGTLVEIEGEVGSKKRKDGLRDGAGKEIWETSLQAKSLKVIKAKQGGYQASAPAVDDSDIPF